MFELTNKPVLMCLLLAAVLMGSGIGPAGAQSPEAPDRVSAETQSPPQNGDDGEAVPGDSEPNAVAGKDQAAEQPAESDQVSTDKTDIEELIVESRQAVDQEVLREHEEKSETETDKEPPKPDAPPEDTPEPTRDEAPGVEPKPVLAEPAPVTEDAVATDSTDVEELVEEVKVPMRQRIEDEYLQKMLIPYTRFKNVLYDRHRISLATEQVMIYQRATGGRRPREQSVYNFSLFGLWELSRDEQDDRGVIGFLFEERDNVTRHSVEDFSREVGSTFRTHTLNSNERSRTAFRQFWWRKRFVDDIVTLTVGKLHHSSYYNRNAYAGSSRTHFLSAPFARNPNRLLPQDGLGANVNIKPNDDYYLSLGFGDARSNVKTSGFDTIQDGDFVKMAEIGLTPDKGNYRFTVWQTDETVIDDIVSKEGMGVAFSFDHEVNQRVGIFGRYGFAESQVDEMTNFISGGFVLQDPWGLAGDLFGCGVSWDENSTTNENEFSIELFHRMQATKMIQVTPSLQVIFEPTRSEKTEPVAVFGLRARMLF